MATETKLTALEHLQMLAEQTKKQVDTLTGNENALSGRIAALEKVGAQANVIETVKVNGKALTVSSKAVNVTVPTAVSALTNDSGYQNASQVSTIVNTAISKSGHASFQRVASVPAVDSAAENILYLVMNAKTGHYDIYAKIKGDSGSYTMELLDDTTVDLSGKVDKVSGKGLSTNDYTTAEKNKLAGIAEGANKYVHPAYTARTSGLYKITVDATGHVSAVTAVTKADLTALGLPAQDTTYPLASSTQDGRMSKADKAKLDGISLSNVRMATDDEVTTMLTTVFGS